MDVQKLATYVIVSDEQIADLDSMEHWLNATDEERHAWAATAAIQRTMQRDQTEHVTLTMDTLLDKLGFTTQYATHLVQPYCTCSDSADGWDYCAHARDLDLAQ